MFKWYTLFQFIVISPYMRSFLVTNLALLIILSIGSLVEVVRPIPNIPSNFIYTVYECILLNIFLSRKSFVNNIFF